MAYQIKWHIHIKWHIRTYKVTYVGNVASMGVEVKTKGVKCADKVAYTNIVAKLEVS